MISFAHENDKDGLLSLWQKCFGDTEEYIKDFFNAFFDDIYVSVMKIDDRVVSASYCLDTEIVSDGKSFKAGYVYAVATLPEYRRRGYAEKVLSHLKENAIKRGNSLIFLTPSNKKNKAYYCSLGFEESFFCYEGKYERTDECSEETEVVKYESFFESVVDDNKINWNKKHIDFSLGVCNGEESYMIKKKDIVLGYAIVNSENNLISEIVCDKSCLSVFLNELCKIKDKRSMIARLPISAKELLNYSCKKSRGMVYYFDTKSCKTDFDAVYIADNLE